MFLQTIYYPLQLFANNSKGKALELFVDSPKYTSHALRRRAVSGHVGRLRQRHAGAERGESPSRTRPSRRSSKLEDKQFSGAVEVAEVNGPDIKAENDFGFDQGERAYSDPPPRSGRKFTYRFPPHSYTMLKVKLT